MSTLLAEGWREVSPAESLFGIHYVLRLGLVHQEYVGSGLSPGQSVSGIEVSPNDTGLLFGPLLGAGIPLAGPVMVDVTAAYYWADATPFMVKPGEPDPGFSRAVTIGTALTVEI